MAMVDPLEQRPVCAAMLGPDDFCDLVNGHFGTS
tara:strand:+ start:1527 stop:1628 length:102 start_codon:yes stop_codon:yes gene_type:complete